MQRVRCYLAPPTCFSSICVSGAAFPWFGPRPCRFRVGRDNGHVGTLSWAGPSSGPSLVIIRGEVCFALLQIITAIFRGRARELSLPWMSTISWPKHPHCKLYYLTKIFAVYPWPLNLKEPQRLSTPITSEIQPWHWGWIWLFLGQVKRKKYLQWGCAPASVGWGCQAVSASEEKTFGTIQFGLWKKVVLFLKMHSWGWFRASVAATISWWKHQPNCQTLSSPSASSRTVLKLSSSFSSIQIMLP